MNFRNIAALAGAVLAIVFAIVNWTLLSTPARWSLLVASVEAPLGLVLLCISAVIAAVLFAFAFKLQLNASIEARKQSAELRTQRELADQAEASRFTELRKYLEAEIAALKQGQQAIAERLGAELATATNTLSAYIGEMDDRLERGSMHSADRVP